MVADIAELSVGREAYYTRELATDHEAYLSGQVPRPLVWTGFRAIFEGRNPTTGELLGRPYAHTLRVRRRAAS